MISPNLRAIRWLVSEEGQRALVETKHLLPLQAKHLIALRDRWGAERAGVLAATAPYVAGAAAKLGTSGVIATERALQQASHIDIARYKASHVPANGCIIDVCCGLGGDSIAFLEQVPVIAVDRDPQLCIIAAHNLTMALQAANRSAAAAVVSQAAEDFFDLRPSKLDGAWLHIDPDRRPSGTKVSDPNYCEPHAEKIASWMQRFEGTIIKMSPAAELPSCFQNVVRREWISHQGQCRQQLVWARNGAVASDLETKATHITRAGQADSFGIAADPTSYDRNVRTTEMPAKIIYDFDPAVRAAGLSAALAVETGLMCIQSLSGFFTSDELPATFGNPSIENRSSSLLAPFEVLWSGKFDEKKLKRQLRAFDPSSLEIKVRGIAVTPEKLRPRLLNKAISGDVASQNPLTLLVSKGCAAIARRIIW